MVDGTIFAISGGVAVQGIDSGGDSWEVYRASSSPHLTNAHLAGVRRMFRDPAQYGGLEMPDDVLETAIGRIGDVGDPLPMWIDVRPDPSGRLWLEQRVCGSSPEEPKTFDIIDLGRGDLATVDVPGGQYLLGVRGRRVLMLRVGELDVEYLELYELEEGSDG